MKFTENWLHELNQLCQRRGNPDFAKYVTEACLNGHAFLFAAKDGWVVVEPRVTPFKHVFVLAAYCAGRDAIARYEPVLMDYAARIGSPVLRFEAARPGYSRVMPKRGWRLLQDGKTWEK